ncbi:ATPase, T2SS/T4P/T4SS family [Salinilacihabitans rarus]|uniref:ATPase, T2SS/T4P/T4SS family n=1 Tax=Salinilacihabitans rarus TaxID=2961596 RepID=UPI0020C8ED12|nr:ATPase, T2SS/T4P/T4SS family [Salinilacihabitans rarus]
MAIDEADQSDAGEFSDAEASTPASDERTFDGPTRNSDVRVGEYTWADFMEEYGYGDEVSAVYPHGTGSSGDQLGLGTSSAVPSGDDWDSVEFDPEAHLGYHPDELSDLITETFAPNAKYFRNAFLEYLDPETTPVVKDVYSLEHYKWEYYYDDEGNRPRKRNGEIEPFDCEETLGFDPDDIEQKLHEAGNVAMELDDVVDARTVKVREELDEDEFFSTAEGNTTVVNRYDLEKAVPPEKKGHFREEERYWVNKPYAFVVIFHSQKENERKYYMIEPYLNEIEEELQEFLSGKLRTAIKYSDDGIKQTESEDGRREVIEEETRRLLKRYDLFERIGGDDESFFDAVRSMLDDEEEDEEGVDLDIGERDRQLEGIKVRPEPLLLEEDSDTLNEYQVEKLLYLLKRNFIGYERIDGIKHDINVEDISCDGYNSPVFVYHSEYEQIITNIHHGEDELDDFVVKLAQRSGKGISKRLPQVDATLPDGSRAQLTLGNEVSDHGTNYTIRQFKDVPFTPIDLINWNTFSLDEMAFLWLAIENHKSLIFAGGTASGKTTSLNAVSLFIPSNTKIVSIEDTREVELPQRNWIASVTRPSFSDDAQGDVDEFDLLEAALRQRPDYIVMGEIRGEEGRTLFQVMSTGHTTYTTFHADSVDEVLKRFTTDPINVSKTMFTALDLVSIQTQTRVQGRKVRRNKSLTEINHYEAENDEINVQDVYQWQAETDEYLKMGDSNTLDEIMFDRGWNREKLQNELFKRKVILAYLIKNELNTYAEVAATIQAFINDPDTILTLIANGQLEGSLEDLREMESVLIDVDPEKEELVPRPDPTNETYNLSMDVLERAEESLFEEYRGKVPSGLAGALGGVDEANPVEADAAGDAAFDAGDWDADDNALGSGGDGAVADTPSWLDEESESAEAEKALPDAQASGDESETAERPALEAAPDEEPTIDVGADASNAGATAEAASTPAGDVTGQVDDGGWAVDGGTSTGESSGTDDFEELFEDVDRTFEELEELEEAEAEAGGDAGTSTEAAETDDSIFGTGADSLFSEDSESADAMPRDEATDPSTGEDSIFGHPDGSPFDEESTSIFDGEEDER